MTEKLYKVSIEAQADLLEIAYYTKQQWGVTQKNNYLKAIRSMFDRITANPQLGRERKDLAKGLRSMPAKDHIIFYLPKSENVYIVRILHRRRDLRRVF
ncbi:MAG: toxin ParE1/3/4 [Phenylobacterium sp.]|jgi:toxin ParE1/3/4